MADEKDFSEIISRAVADFFESRMPTWRDEAAKQVLAGLQPVIQHHAELHVAKGEAEQALKDAVAKATADQQTIQASGAKQEQAPGTGSTDVLNASVLSIYDATSQTEILKALLEGVAQFSARAALFVVKASNLNAWKSSGFENEGAFKGLALDSSAGLAARAIRDKEPVSAAAAEFNSAFVQTHGNPFDGNANVLPLVVRDKVAAVVYVDAGVPEGGKCDFSAVQLLVRSASSWLELMALRKTGGAAAGEAHAAEPVIAAASASAASAGPTLVAEPASRAAEKPAPAPLPAPAAGPSPLDGLSPQDQEIHKKAKRFARLLVDEIKLYNPSKVAEGKQHKDLYERLKEDIDKSRATYEKRYGSTSAGSAGYFNAEVIRILAENDVGILGASFQQ